MERPFRILSFLLSALLSLLFGCSGGSCPSALVVADSLISVAPDSALRYLEHLDGEMSSAPESARMYYRLLCIKAADKAYIPHTSDSLILPVLRYYEKKDKRHLAEARYYAGRVYRDLGDAPQALDYFEKALEVLPKEEAGRLESLIYSQMGTLFYFQGLYQEALKTYKKCSQLSIASADTVGLIYDWRDMANMYYELDCLDSTRLYMEEASRLCLKLRRTDMYGMIRGQLVGIYLDLQEYDSARNALSDGMQNMEGQSESAVYSIAADFYLQTGQEDSAMYYYRKLLDCGTVYAKRTAYRELLRRAAVEAKAEDVLCNLSGYQQYLDSLQKIDKAETVLRMHSLYNYQIREKEILLLKLKSQEKERVLWILTGTLLMFAIAFIAYRQYHQRKKLQQDIQIEQLRQIEMENRERIASLEACQTQKDKLAGNLLRTASATENWHTDKQKRKLELINRILEQEKVETVQETEAKQVLFSSALYGQLQARASSARGEANISSEEWEVLHELVSSAFPRFFERLSALCTTLNENEQHVCLLTKIQFRPADIARLLGLKRETVSSVRARLYKKVTGENGTAEKWDKILLAL